MLRAAAQEIADFMCSRTSQHLAEFWLPFTAHLLASAAMVLLRCTVETVDVIASIACRRSLESLRRRLRTARDVDEWDLADIFLSQCDEPISRILGHNEVQVSNESNHDHQAINLANQDSSNTDFGMYPELMNNDPGLPFPVESLGYPSETLWNMFDFTDLQPL